MQRRMLSLLAVCCTAVAGIAAAQTPSARFGLGGGATIPVGTYKDSDKIGWHGLGLVQFGLPAAPLDKLGSAACRDRGQISADAGALNRTTKLYGGLARGV